MQITHCEQGSPEWFQARCGVITASMFSEVRRRVNGLNDQQRAYLDNVLLGYKEADAAAHAGYKKAPTGDKIERAIAGESVGDFSNQALEYAFRLAVERISEEPLDEGFETWQARRGHELEPTARGLHAMEIDRPITQIGFISTQDGKFGASVDGLIGEDGGSEYKCLVSPEKLRKTLVDGDLTDYMDQVQGGMWVTGRLYWHLVFYCPMLRSIDKELFIHVVRRDDEYIELMKDDLLAFEEEVSRYESKLRGDATLHTPEPPPQAA